MSDQDKIKVVSDRPSAAQSGVHELGGHGAFGGQGAHGAHGAIPADMPRFLRVFRFNDFIADERLFQLRRMAAPVPVQPKVLELIFYLLRHRDRVVTKAELFESLWSGVVVTGASLLYAVKEARKVLGDDATKPRFVSNVRGRGYRFIASVEEGTGPLIRRKELASRLQSDVVVVKRGGAALVGRDAPLAQLRVQLMRASEGEANALFLTGDPGIGKTRVAEEFASYARGQGASVLFGRCYEVEGAPPFWPWVQAVRGYLAQHDLKEVKRAAGSHAADLAAMVPELRELFPDLEVRAPIESAQARFRVFEAFAAFLREASSSQPVVIILDDVHRADEPSLLLLKYVVGQLGSERVLLLITGRSASVTQNETLRQIQSEIVRRDPGRHIELAGLPTAEIARLVFESTGKSASDAMLTRLHDLTFGNPLFLTQVLHMLSAEGRLSQLEAPAAGTPGTPTSSASPTPLALPAGVTEGLSRYLDFLAEPVRRVLSIGSVFGLELSAAPLAAVSGMGYELVLECLGEAVRWHVLADAPEIEGPYRFAHVLVRDVLYAKLSPAERMRLHRQAGEALLKHYQGDQGAAGDQGDQGDHGANEIPLAQLAHHFLEAASPSDPADTARAVDYAIAAARSANERAAYEDAAALCARALRVAAAYGCEPGQRDALQAQLTQAQERLRS